MTGVVGGAEKIHSKKKEETRQNSWMPKPPKKALFAGLDGAFQVVGREKKEKKVGG